MLSKNGIAIICFLLSASLSFATETGNFYNVRFVGCYDGDTCSFLIPWLPPPFSSVKIRAVGVDTPEKGWRAKCQQEKDRATLAAAATTKLMEQAATIDLLNLGAAGLYGRNPASVVINRSIVWERWLVENGFAVLSTGKRTYDWCQ